MPWAASTITSSTITSSAITTTTIISTNQKGIAHDERMDRGKVGRANTAAHVTSIRYRHLTAAEWIACLLA